MPGRQRPLDLEGVLGVYERLAGQHPADRVDRLRREVREVRERFLFDLAVLAVRAPQQCRGVLVLPRPSRSRAHMHRTRSPGRTTHVPDYTARTPAFVVGTHYRNKQAEIPTNTGIPASTTANYKGNFGLDHVAVGVAVAAHRGGRPAHPALDHDVGPGVED